jgi:hypothetical protein
MSRLTGADALGLYEAYQAVYNPQELTEEQVWEEVETWVNSLLEEGYDLSDYTWEEMYEEYLNEDPKKYTLLDLIGKGAEKAGQSLSRGVQGWQKSAQGLSNKSKEEPPTKPTPKFADLRGSNTPGSNTPAIPKVRYPVAGTPPTKTITPTATKTASTPPTKPTTTAAAPKPAAAPAAKPAGSAMDQWAKANTKLAAAKAERDRTRGTSATTNPLMKDMKSRLPAPKTPSPTTSSTAFSKSTPSLGSSTPEVKSAGTSSGSAGFGKSAPSIGSSAFKPSPASAAPTPTPTTAAATTPAAKPATPKPSLQDTIKKNRGITSSFDLFDLVKGHLLDEGYADTEEAALAIMINMSEEWRQSIVEERAPGVKPYKAGPTQAEVRADAKRASKKKTEKDKDKEGYGPEEKFKDWKLTSTPSTVSKTGETISQRMDKEAPYKTRPFSPLFTKQGSRTASAVTRATEGPGEPQSVTMPRKKSKPSREIVRKNKDTNESYDYILSHLIYEGYANTVESAEKIISNMSEDWILSIIQ